MFKAGVNRLEMIDKLLSRSSDQRNEKVRLRECLKTKTTLYKMSVRERESKKERKRDKKSCSSLFSGFHAPLVDHNFLFIFFVQISWQRPNPNLAKTALTNISSIRKKE